MGGPPTNIKWAGLVARYCCMSARLMMDRSTRRKIILSTVVQIFQLAIAGCVLMLGVTVFIYTAPLFDLLGPVGQRSTLPKGVFQNVSDSTPGVRSSISWIIDLPIFMLAMCYFLAVIWLKCRGLWSWLMTACMLITVALFISINTGLTGDNTNWRYFYTRSVTIFLDVLVLSFAWTVIVVILLHIRDWFPFKIKKSMSGGSCERILAVIWNFIALYLVLSLCILSWYSRLYTSWACITDTNDILIFCQFTNQIQCYRCEEAIQCTNLEQCVKGDPSPYHCLAPLYTINPKSALCVFNFNIGPFTFVSVFASVGGLYFFLRTTLNAFIKCIRVVLFISYKFIMSRVKKKSSLSNEGDGGLPLPASTGKTERVSLLASLPEDYLAASTTLKEQTTINK